MIGKLLDDQQMTAEEEGRVLCTVMRPGGYVRGDRYGPCLVGTMTDYSYPRINCLDRERFGDPFDVNGNIECRYDRLCERFGVERVNNAVRNRILTNKVKRALKDVTAQETKKLEYAVSA